MTAVSLALGAVGHVILWVMLVNRLHALAINRRVMNLLTALCGLALVSLPVAVATTLWWLAPVEAVGRGSLFWAAAWSYVAGCDMLAIVVPIQWLWHAFHPERLGAVVKNDTTVLDLRKSAGSLIAPGIPTWLSRIPGNEVLTVHFQEKHLAIPGLPAACEGLRIVHLTDLHMSGRIAKDYFSTVMDEVSRLQPDLVAVTGDLVEHDRCLDWIPDALGRLHAPGGVYFVLGNHDKKVRRQRLLDALAEAGWTYVGGRWLQTTVRDAPLVIAGNELPWYSPAANLADCPPHDDAGLPLRLLLAHTPDQFGWAQTNNVDLMLAGHNHGGQIRMPFVGAVLAPSLFGTRYASGVFRRNGTVLHVSRGTSSLAVVRWNCPPEVALLVLRTDS